MYEKLRKGVDTETLFLHCCRLCTEDSIGHELIDAQHGDLLVYQLPPAKIKASCLITVHIQLSSTRSFALVDGCDWLIKR
jgi:hypothetical protein